MLCFGNHYHYSSCINECNVCSLFFLLSTPALTLPLTQSNIVQAVKCQGDTAEPNRCIFSIRKLPLGTRLHYAAQKGLSLIATATKPWAWLMSCSPSTQLEVPGHTSVWADSNITGRKKKKKV